MFGSIWKHDPDIEVRNQEQPSWLGDRKGNSACSQVAPGARGLTRLRFVSDTKLSPDGFRSPPRPVLQLKLMLASTEVKDSCTIWLPAVSTTRDTRAANIAYKSEWSQWRSHLYWKPVQNHSFPPDCKNWVSNSTEGQPCTLPSTIYPLNLGTLQLILHTCTSWMVVWFHHT